MHVFGSGAGEGDTYTPSGRWRSHFLEDYFNAEALGCNAVTDLTEIT